jgi:signal peptidase I
MPSPWITVSPSVGEELLMKSYGRELAPLSGAFMIVVLIAVWVAFAPLQAGGQASYVIVNGNSMEPKLHKGDLMIVREADSYGVGDVVAYRHPDIGPVIHRIVGREGDRFVLQGDNNSWLDTYRPLESELIGKSWIHAPSAGKLIELLRFPGSMAVLAGMMGVTAMSMFVTTTKDQRKRPRHGQRPVEKKKDVGSASPPRGGGAEGMLTMLAAVMLASLLLGFFAFGRSESRTVSDDARYEHMGEFSYFADVPYGVYDTDEVRTGEPVFRRLTQTVHVRFDYRLTSDTPTDDVEGTYQLVAEVSDVGGWKRTILLEPYRRFDGGGFTAMGTLDLSEVQKLIGNLERRTGFHSDRYAVSIVPQVSAQGTLAGQELNDEFAPRLDFWFDSVQLQLQSPTTASTDPLSPSEEGSDPLKPSQEGSVERSRTEPNTLPILGFDLLVPTARKLSLFGLALSLAGLLWLGIPRVRALRGDEPTRIRASYGPLLVSMRGGDLSSGGHLVEVSAFEELAKLAEGGGQSILHQTSGAIHDYYLRDSGVTYHYRAAILEPGDTLLPADIR